MDSEIKCVYPRRVAADMVAPLPLVKYEGEIELVEDESQLDSALAEISRESVLGFDTETRPNFNRGKSQPVSILQLAGAEKVWVIRLDPLAERLADIFKVLENPAIKKAGLAVQGDIKSLRARCAFSPAGFVDVSASTTKIGIINTGMKNLAALIFGERISKAALVDEPQALSGSSRDFEGSPHVHRAGAAARARKIQYTRVCPQSD